MSAHEYGAVFHRYPASTTFLFKQAKCPEWQIASRKADIQINCQLDLMHFIYLFLMHALSSTNAYGSPVAAVQTFSHFILDQSIALNPILRYWI